MELNVQSVRADRKAGIMKEKRNYRFLVAEDKDSDEECENEAITDRQQIYSTIDT